MNDHAANRRFIWLVLVVSIVANAAASAVVLGERRLQPFWLESSLDQYRGTLRDEVGRYGAGVRSLQDRIDAEVDP